MNKKSLIPYFLPVLTFCLITVMFLGFGETVLAQTNLGPSLELFPGESQALPITGDIIPTASKSTSFRLYLQQLYRFAIAGALVIATVLIMIGGVIWITSAGNQSRIEKAKSFIIDSIIGVVILFAAVAILNLINPNLVNLQPLGFQELGTYGACVDVSKSKTGEDSKTCVIKNKQECTGTFFERSCQSVCEMKPGTDNCIKIKSLEGGLNSCKKLSRTFNVEQTQKNSFDTSSKTKTLDSQDRVNVCIGSCNTKSEIGQQCKAGPITESKDGKTFTCNCVKRENDELNTSESNLQETEKIEANSPEDFDF